MVGQYHGPAGTAALAVVAPIWNLIYSLGLLMGIGGSVLFGISRGMSGGEIRQSNEYFTASVIGSAVLAAAAWLAILIFDRELLLFFGADSTTLELAMDYIFPVKFVIPCFLFTQTLAAYLRNDKNPALATAAVLAGGIFNIFGDYFFVFVCDMGAMGAGLATAIGSVISILVMLTHFLTGKNTLCLSIPNQFLRIFMNPTESVLRIAPAIIRNYGMSFLLLPLNIFSTYYFQAILKPQAAFIVSISRGLVISGMLILLLPAISGAESIWYAMPLTEFAVAIYALFAMARYTKTLKTAGKANP